MNPYKPTPSPPGSSAWPAACHESLQTHTLPTWEYRTASSLREVQWVEHAAASASTLDLVARLPLVLLTWCGAGMPMLLMLLPPGWPQLTTTLLPVLASCKVRPGLWVAGVGGARGGGRGPRVLLPGREGPLWSGGGRGGYCWRGRCYCWQWRGRCC